MTPAIVNYTQPIHEFDTPFTWLHGDIFSKEEVSFYMLGSTPYICHLAACQ